MKLPSISYFFNLAEFEHKEIFKNLKYPWEALTSLDDYLKSWLKKNNKGNIFIGEKTIIDKTARIEGPVIIGNNCKIGFQTHLRGPVIIGNKSVINKSEIKHSIVLNGVQAAHFNYIGNSIIGNNVNLGGGVKLANLRFDQQTPRIRHKKGKIDTKLKKFGAIIGDKSQLGCNSVLNPGTLLGKECLVYPLASVKPGLYQNKSAIKQ